MNRSWTQARTQLHLLRDATPEFYGEFAGRLIFYSLIQGVQYPNPYSENRKKPRGCDPPLLSLLPHWAAP